MAWFIEQYGQLIEQHPIPFVIFGGLCAMGTAAIVRWVYQEWFQQKQERLSAKNDLINLLKAQLNEARQRISSTQPGNRR